MMQRFRNQMALAAELAQAGRAECCVGIVTSYDPSNASAKVRLEPADPDFPDRTLTGWLPVASPWVGNTWGLDAPPSPGDQVEVKFFGGEIETGYVCGRLYSDAARPPGAPSGEFWIVHQSGSALRFKNDGTVEVVAQTTAKYTAQLHHFVGPVQMDNTLLVEQTITGQGGMDISGDNGSGATSTVTGNLDTTGTIHNNGVDIGSTHRHSNGNGGANTGTPV
ncbi:phage baseplate assembly protein V [Cupriavidus sp. YAF13]|uniref:phage baseplate assembly protein V n=1 Tax=Cupriavidus sp. YAF13 TaxID=3233075 RepID=UPI003F8F3A29